MRCWLAQASNSHLGTPTQNRGYSSRSSVMKLVTVFLLLLATNLALAQTSGGSGGTGTSGAAAPATPAPPTGQPSVQPGATAPSPADNSTVGQIGRASCRERV